MIKEEHVEKALEFMRDNAAALGKAKAERIYMEQFRKSKKAILYGMSPDGTIPERESWVYAHSEYLEVLDGLKAAVEEEERLRWMMTAAEAKIDVWRTQQATNRALDRGHH
jgi:hypothetical protein